MLCAYAHMHGCGGIEIYILNVQKKRKERYIRL